MGKLDVHYDFYLIISGEYNIRDYFWNEYQKGTIMSIKSKAFVTNNVGKIKIITKFIRLFECNTKYL